MKYLSGALLLVGFLLAGCKNDKENNSHPIDFNMESLEDSLPAIQTKKQLVGFLTRRPVIRDFFFNRSGFKNDSAFINDLFTRFTNPYLDTLLMETHAVYGDGSALKEEFGKAFAKIKSYYPDFKPPKIQTMISGLQTDMTITDTLIVIGLDYFLGPKAKYRPKMYDYMLRRYNKDFIVPSVMLIYGIDYQYNKTDMNDQSVLADMVAYGKAYYFAKHMVPYVADSTLIGYTRNEWNSAVANEDLIYVHLLDKEVIYSTSHLVKQRYLEERPKTLEIAQNCPGRIGTWVGWQIVNAYASKKTDRTLPEIMSVASAEEIFKESRYKPVKK